jgi:hypothetical protein
MAWFAALLAVSPCADAPSVDEVIRRGRRGRVTWVPSAA